MSLQHAAEILCLSLMLFCAVVGYWPKYNARSIRKVNRKHEPWQLGFKACKPVEDRK